jgi:hypothetical protein
VDFGQGQGALLSARESPCQLAPPLAQNGKGGVGPLEVGSQRPTTGPLTERQGEVFLDREAREDTSPLHNVGQAKPGGSCTGGTRQTGQGKRTGEEDDAGQDRLDHVAPCGPSPSAIPWRGLPLLCSVQPAEMPVIMVRSLSAHQSPIRSINALDDRGGAVARRHGRSDDLANMNCLVSNGFSAPTDITTLSG